MGRFVYQTKNQGYFIEDCFIIRKGLGCKPKLAGDTPTGTYDIPDENMWMSGGSTASYGPNHRLILDTESGEAEESGRDEFRMHGGRQGENDTKQEPDEPLQKTNGCIRMYDVDIANMKTLTDGLTANDAEEVVV